MGEDIVRTEEKLYSFEAAVNKYWDEQNHSWKCRQKKLEEIRQEQKEKRQYFLNQKLFGFLGLVAVVIVTALCGNLACLALAFPAVYAMFTDKMVIVNNYYITHGGFDQWKM